MIVVITSSKLKLKVVRNKVKRKALKKLSACLSMMGIFSSLNVNAGLMEVLNENYPNVLFSEKFVNNQTIKLLPGVNVEFHSNDYWNQDLTYLVYEKLFNYSVYFHEVEVTEENIQIFFKDNSSSLVQGRMLLREVFGKNGNFSDDVVVSFVHKVRRFFGVNKYSFPNWKPGIYGTKKEDGDNPRITRIVLFNILFDECFTFNQEYKDFSKWNMSVEEIKPDMRNNKPSNNILCKPIFQEDFYNLNAVRRELQMRNLGTPYDCLLEYMKYVSLHSQFIQEIIYRIDKLIFRTAIDDPFIFANKFGMYRKSFLRIDGMLKNEAKWIMLKELGTLWLNSKNIEDFNKRFESFVNQATLNFGIDPKDMIESIINRRNYFQFLYE